MLEINFEPFQKVLVRSTDTMQWSAALYSHQCGKTHICNGIMWEYCIPWEGNERFLGTSAKPMKPQPEFVFGEHVEVSINTYDWCKAVYINEIDNSEINYRMRYRALDVNGDVSLWEHCRKAEW